MHGGNESTDLEKLAECYAQLVLNYEQRRDVDTAEAFQIGEMDTRRRRLASGIKRTWLRVIREHRSVLGIYRLSSIYGTSYSRGAAVLVCLVLSLLFLWTGIAPITDVSGDKQSRSAPGPIKYQLLPDSGHPAVAPRVWLEFYAKALVFTLSVVDLSERPLLSNRKPGIGVPGHTDRNRDWRTGRAAAICCPPALQAMKATLMNTNSRMCVRKESGLAWSWRGGWRSLPLIKPRLL